MNTKKLFALYLTFFSPFAFAGFNSSPFSESCPVQPPAVQDPFDPASCTGSPITLEEALERFQPTRSVSSPMGKGRLFTRTQSCNTLTGCGPWQTTYLNAGFYNNEYHNGAFSYPYGYDAGPFVFTITDARTQQISLQTQSEEPLKFFSFPPNDQPCYGGACYSYVLPRGFNFHCDDVGQAQISCSTPEIQFAKSVINGNYYEYSEGLHWNANFVGAEPIQLKGLLTNHCLRLTGNYKTVVAKDGNYQASETVYINQF